MSKTGMFMDSLPKDPSIVIVGGGVSGLAAATRLLDRGFTNVKVLEAENRLGGRVNTVAFGQRYIDLGAHWVHGQDGNAVYSIGNDLDLLTSSEDFEKVEFIADDGDRVPSDVGMGLYIQIGELLGNSEDLKKHNGDLQDFIVSRCKKIGKEIIGDEELMQAYIDWLIKFECSIEGSDYLTDVSSAGLTHYTRCEGDPLITWKDGGYSSIIDILLRMHPQCDLPCVDLEEKVFLNSEVKEIDWSGLVALVKCSNGSIHKADHVIVTTSLGVLKEKNSTMFNPPLPDSKVKAIRGLGYGTVNKVYLYFEYQWWPDGCSGFSFLRKSTNKITGEHSWEKDLIGFYTESSAPCVLAGWLVGDAAREMEIFTEEQVKEGCYRALKKFLGKAFVIPMPVEVTRSKWFSNPHFRGSYSFRSLSTEALKTGAAELAKSITNFYDREILLFAGEATHRAYYSTVHGALESGWREADYLAEKYSKSRKCSL